MKRLKISEVLEENVKPSQISEDNSENNTGILRSALAGLTAGTVESVPMAAGFIVNSPKMLYKLAKYPLDKDMKFAEVLEPMQNSKLVQAGIKSGDYVRNLFGVDESKLSPTEQVGYLAGEWLPTIATGGTYGALKVGSNVAKTGGKAAVKALAKKGASYGTKKAIYKSGKTLTDTALAMAAPGIQISKEAKLPSKIAQFGIQAIPGLTGNELLHLNAENKGLFDDYSMPTEEDITLIKDKRKIGKKEYIDQLDDSLYEQYKIDKQISNAKKSLWLQNTLAAAAVVGAGIMTARYTGAGAKLAKKVEQKLADASGYDLLTPEQKMDFAISNRYAFLDNLVERNLLPEEIRNAMYRDYSVITNRVWEEGVLVNDDIKIDLGIKPKELYNNLVTLSQKDPVLAEDLNKYIENVRLIQDDAFKSNRQAEKLDKNAYQESTNEYVDRIIKMSPEERDTANKYGTYNRIIHNAKFINNIYGKNGNPLVQKILNDLSTLNNNMLEYYKERNYFSGDQIAKMKRNRSINLLTVEEPDIGVYNFSPVSKVINNKLTPIDLNLYKQAIAKPDTGILDKVKYFINRASYSDTSTGYLSSATPRNSIDNLKVSEDLVNVLEQSIKTNIYNVEKNFNLNKLLKNYSTNNMKQLQTYIDDKIDAVDAKWNEVLAEQIKMTETDNYDAYITKLDEYNKFLKDTTNYIVKHMEAKYLGSKQVYSTEGIEGMKAVDIKKQLLSGLNNPKADDSKLVENIKNNYDFNNELREISNVEERPGIIRTIENGELQIYQVDPLYAKALILEPSISNVIGRGFYVLKNFQQSTLTGKFNPFFSGRSAIYTGYEGFAVLPVLSKLLNTGKISRLEYLSECFHNIKNLYAEEKAKYLAKWHEDLKNDPLYDKWENTKDKKTLKKSLKHVTETNSMKERLTQVLQANADNPDLNLIHLMQDGGAVQNKPYNTTSERVITINGKTRITPKTFDLLSKIHTPRGAKKVIDIINMMQNIIRDAPALSINTLLYKKLKNKLPIDVTTGKIQMDQKLLDKMAYTINTHTANSALYGAGNGVLGGLSDFIRNYFSYGAVTINSIAPKLRSLGLGKGIKNTRELLLKLIDKNTTYSDILDHMGMMYRSTKGNEYLKSLIYVSVIPSIISYIWNHGSEDNIKSYYSYSDSNKGSKFILTNVFGKGVHLSIPKDQELALSDAIVYAVLDNFLHLSKYNPNDPNFKASVVIGEALARSMGLDGNPSLNIIANAQGYNFSANIFDERAGITKLSKNIINNDLSETAYQNGWVNQQVTNIINNIFGTLGSALMMTAEEGKVGARKSLGTGSIDATLAFLDRTFGNSSLIPMNFDITRSSSATTQTVQNVYKTRNLLDKIATIKDKTPEQQAIYDLIKMYNRNRIEPIKKQITDLRNDIIQVKSNGRTSDGQLQSYYSRKNNINELNNKLKELFKNEFEEYNKLDNLIQQQYGIGINIENFMQKFSYLNGENNE